MPTKSPAENPVQPLGSKLPPTLGDFRKERRPLNARALAWVAEGADGRRDEELVLFENTNGKLELGEKGKVPEERVILDVFTKSRKKQRNRERMLKILPDWDAVFLSESAVEKFVFPYYAAQRLLTATELTQLKAKFYAEDVIGIIHKPPSRPLLLVELADGTVDTRPFEVGAALEIEIQSGALPTYIENV
jgi:hypothetical protein